MGEQKPSGYEKKYTIGVNGDRNLLVMSILQIILLYIEVNNDEAE